VNTKVESINTEIAGIKKDHVLKADYTKKVNGIETAATALTGRVKKNEDEITTLKTTMTDE